MTAEFSLGLALCIGLFAFICEYADSALGMGYGTTLAPVLLVMGYAPLQIVPVILVSELVTGLLAGALHHKEGNVDFKPKIIDINAIASELRMFNRIKASAKTAPLHLKVALTLAACSIIGTIAAVFLAVRIPELWVKLYTGFLVFAMGIVILLSFKKTFAFSWKKIIGLGLLASFNKGISGGGYGPLITGGQILSGVESKNAVGITSLAEGLTCAVGVMAYFLAAKSLDLSLAPFVVTGAVCSVPLAVKSVKKMTEQRLKLAIAAFSVILGLATLWKALWTFA